MDATMFQSASRPVAMMVFGDLHGRVLPAFRLATAWARDHQCHLDGILQVGDLGYFPDLSRMDRATIRHAQKDPLEYGTQDIISLNPFANNVFEQSHCPPGMWFTAGNHEDFDELERLAGAAGRQADFAVDAYCQVRGIRDGYIAELAGQLRVGAIWGVDGESKNRRTNLPKRGYIQESSVNALLAEPFDVLLCHDAPFGAKRPEYGSELLLHLIHLNPPKFAFFGHYKGDGGRSEQDHGDCQIYHMAGFEMQTRTGVPETGSVGVLTWQDGHGEFTYLDPVWLKTFSRHNWKSR